MPTEKCLQRIKLQALGGFLTVDNNALIGQESLTAEQLFPILDSADWPVELDVRSASWAIQTMRGLFWNKRRPRPSPLWPHPDNITIHSSL